MICLSMIVKNESAVLERCLESVKPLIDAWEIVDTGSTDNTPKLARKILRGIPGQVRHTRWDGFSAARNLALKFASRSTYALLVDADDTIEGQLPKKAKLKADAYSMRIAYGDTSYWRPQLVRTGSGLHFEGVVHEALTSDTPVVIERLDTLVYRVGGGGARSSDPEKYRRDAELLEQSPATPRNVFYLAQSWRDAGEPKKALDAYRRRAEMAGWEEETYFSLHEIGRMMERLRWAAPEIIAAYLAAFEYRPTRAEPLCSLARYLRESGHVKAAYPFARAASLTPRPDDSLFVDDSVYAWRAQDEAAIAAFYVGRTHESQALNRSLLESTTLPISERPRIEENLRLSR